MRTDVTAEYADRVRLRRVLLDTVVNGMDAMEGVANGGRLLELRGQRSDGGVGIDLARMERLFEAFYTTKAQGMGMGLAISRSIIEMHGVTPWAEPNDGFGATFPFSLPASEDGPS